MGKSAVEDKPRMEQSQDTDKGEEAPVVDTVVGLMAVGTRGMDHFLVDPSSATAFDVVGVQNCSPLVVRVLVVARNKAQVAGDSTRRVVASQRRDDDAP